MKKNGTERPSGREQSEQPGLRTGPRRLLNQMKVFNYVTVEGAPTYQAIINVFYEAKQHYRIELRPQEVLERITGAGFQHEAESEEKLEYYLGQLVAWGNLARGHDTTSVSRIEDFYRKRYVFHLSAVGEAAHRAVREVAETIGRSGSLQANMLVKILDALNGIAATASGTNPDPETLVQHLHDLHASFDTLTREATRFMGDLSRHLGEGRMEEDRFVLHKHAVLSYISRFVDQLRRLAPEICEGIKNIQSQGVDALFEVAARSADLPPGMGGEDPRRIWVDEQLERWSGICAWFVGETTWNEPTVERLSGLAVNAVVGLTRTLGRLNDSRLRPVDRQADFRTLARWFTGCEGDGEAHQLWQSAFGMYSSRHFHIAEEDADLVSPSTSWWESEPIEVPVRLRTRGAVTSSGRPAPVRDLTKEKQWIARKREQERVRFEKAMMRFAGKGPIRLGDLVSLDEAQFELLLELLGEVLSVPRRGDGMRGAGTQDGRYRVFLEPPDGEALVSIQTPRGVLSVRNYSFAVEDIAATRGTGREGADEPWSGHVQSAL